MDKEKIERRWGWLANIIATTTVTMFTLLESYLKFCFTCLEHGPQGFLFLIGLHLFLLAVVL